MDCFRSSKRYKKPGKLKDEVVVYSTDKHDSELFSLKKSVKAQVHSLEAKTKSPISKGVRNPVQRSRSENPPLMRGDRESPSQPPPMPEKVKIHLKNNHSMERNPQTSLEKMKKSPYGRYDKTKKTAQNSAVKVSGLENVELGRSQESRKPAESRQQQFRRARSVGPVVGAAQRELSNLGLSKLPGSTNPVAIVKERKSRSRGRTENNSTGGSNPRSKTSIGNADSPRIKSEPFGPDRKHLGALMSPPSPVDMAPRHIPSKLPARQKSMIDLREPHWDSPRHMVHPVQVGRIPGSTGTQPPRSGPPPPLVRSATEHDIRLRRKRPPGPGSPAFNDLPPHIRQHMIRQRGLRVGEGNMSMFGLDPASLNRNGGYGKDPESVAMRQLNLEAQRELLVRRGFSPTHPYISGEVPIHPELQGQLPFNVPSRTIPMRPEDYRRFKPELWLRDHNPNPVPFSDIAVLQSELELRRRREIYRQSSRRRVGGVMPENESNNFTSLPWDEIIPRRQMEQFQHQLQQHMAEQQHQQIIMQQQRSRSQDPRRKNRPFSLFNNSGWFNPAHVARESDVSSATRVKKQGHWVLKERPPSEQTQLQSMPPMAIGSLKDSGIGEDPEMLSRSGVNRSSFGMALKDKFQRNPNMYFPPDGRGPARASSSSSSGGGVEKRHSMASKSTSIDDLSDTDTLIHNMSEGSYEKDRTSLGSGGHNSLGSASGKGSRSSGNSSLSPHNSMEGSPRMIPKQKSKFQPSPSVTPMSTQTINSSGISFNKKTIRNYTPKESSNMLREFEDRRNNSYDWREREKRASSQPPIASSTQNETGNRVLRSSQSQDDRNFDVSEEIEDSPFRNEAPKLRENPRKTQNSANRESKIKEDATSQRRASGGATAEDKTSMERMIEDFHRNLPPPPVDSRQQKPTGRVGEPVEHPTLAPSVTTASSSKRTSKHGTLSSQISNWSAASSVASFDYQPMRHRQDSHSILPALTEVEYVSGAMPETPPTRSRNHTPKGERVPPGGASADSPKPFVQRIEIGEKRSVERSVQSNSRSKSKLSAKDEKSESVFIPEPVPGETDEFSNLRKLISEGRISGLSDKPPNFVPPTPPTAKKATPQKSKEGTGLEKKPSRTSAERPRKAREAPKPPANQDSPLPVKSNLTQQQQLPVNPEVKLLTSRHRESLEDLTQMENRRRRSSNNEVKRSSSNHGARPNGFDPHQVEATTAQLVAGSAEKKFNFNPFKGMWKKKHYSFDFN